MTDDELNVAVAERLFGWTKPTDPEPKCPECDGSLRRPKCLWELGSSCPRHEILRDYERSLKPVSYATDRNHAAEMEARIAVLGLQHAYADALMRVCDVGSFSLEDNLFKLVNATARQRCIAALLAVQGERP